MPEQQAARRFRSIQVRPYTVALWVLFVGLLISFAANVTQDRKIEGLRLTLLALRQDHQKQLSELREAQSASLEQDLLRLDQVTTQLQKANESERLQAAELSNKTRADLARTVEQRHQEMITAISDLRADLRSEASARTPSSPTAQRPVVEAAPVPVATEVPLGPQALPAGPEKPAQESVSPSPAGKKSFWSKLNPFRQHSPRPTSASNETSR